MAQTILLKKSSVAGKKPTELNPGEPAVNLVDRVLYVGGVNKEVIPVSTNYYDKTVANGSTIKETEHRCGKHPFVQVLSEGEIVITDVKINADGDVTISYNNGPATVDVQLIGR